MIEALFARGVRSRAVDLPYTSFDADVAEVRRVVAEVEGPSGVRDRAVRCCETTPEGQN